ncbi:MAG: DUF86 domain-containing protein [Paenibacillus sp.]|nr:DUF86 domain-containing protein [Paenibacillus sp.]
MESQYFHNKEIAMHTLGQMADACGMIIDWNKSVTSVEDYVGSSDGMQKMAACCMLLESIGEGVKKIDKLLPEFLQEHAPEIPWRSIKGLRDHIAHGYFNIDADVVYDVAVNEIPSLKVVFVNLMNELRSV